jgi:hypothetical protein
MTVLSDLDFDQWVTFLFDRPVNTDREWYWDDDFELGDERVCLVYCERLFSAPGFLLDRYSQQQLDQAFWLLPGPRLAMFDWLFSPSIPRSLRRSCGSSIFALFRDLFAVACSDTLSAIDQEPSSPLNSACYMWWDNGRSFGLRPEDADIDDTLLSVMSHTLDLQSRPCQESALHGLGHWHASYPDRVEEIIDAFIGDADHLDQSLLGYAKAARTGAIQ